MNLPREALEAKNLIQSIGISTKSDDIVQHIDAIGYDGWYYHIFLRVENWENQPRDESTPHDPDAPEGVWRRVKRDAAYKKKQTFNIGRVPSSIAAPSWESPIKAPAGTFARQFTIGGGFDCALSERFALESCIHSNELVGPPDWRGVPTNKIYHSWTVQIQADTSILSSLRDACQTLHFDKPCYYGEHNLRIVAIHMTPFSTFVIGCFEPLQQDAGNCVTLMLRDDKDQIISFLMPSGTLEAYPDLQVMEIPIPHSIKSAEEVAERLVLNKTPWGPAQVFRFDPSLYLSDDG